MVFTKPGVLFLDAMLRKKYGNVWGFYEGRDPTIVVADVDIIKQIMVKDFSKFINRRKIMLQGVIRKGLFSAVDNHWKYLRRMSSPTFSSGKLKYMSKLVNQCVAQLKESLQENADKGISFEAKEVTSAFTMDVIAATGFGLQLDSQKNVKNPFNVNGRRFFDSLSSPLNLIVLLVPYLFKPLDKLGICSLDKTSLNFFTHILKQTMKHRRESPQSNDHPDFLQLMMDAENLLDNADEEVKKEIKEGNLTEGNREIRGMTEDEIIAQCLLFFLAGYETTATTMAFMMYNLASHPDVQEKVLVEVQEIFSGQEELKYEDLKDLKYMDMCIEETLRMYPPALRVDRKANEEVTYKGIKIPKDFLVAIPIRALHYDPEIWPDPDKFDPNRFSPEAKAARDPYYYMPFGVGPRQCVGMRLAQMELKMALASIVRSFNLKVSSKFKEPLTLANVPFPLVEGGIWLDVESRQ